MPTEEELTKARDAALQCVQQGAEFLDDIPLTQIAAKLATKQPDYEAMMARLSKGISPALIAWNDAVSSDVLDHILLACAELGLRYKVGGCVFATAHEASRECAQMYAGEFENDVQFAALLEYYDAIADWDAEVITSAVKTEWAESVRQLVEPRRTDAGVPDESSLDEGDRNIVHALRSQNKRMTTDPLLQKAFGTTTGAGKLRLASLVKRRIIDKRRFVDPKGYGLPEWGDSTS